MLGLDINLKRVKEEVDNSLSTSPLIIRKYTKHLLKSEGKYLRAAAVLIAAEKEDGSVADDAIKFAAAIEILHLATLVHDDVMDNADMRRGVVTLHKEYGRKTAVITGDYLLAVATSTANRIGDRNAYIRFNMPDYMEEIALGELKQHINNGNVRISTKEYYDIIRGKTAALFEASFYAGFTTSSEPDDHIEIYKKIGNNVGMMFQLMDDCIDFESTKGRAKKPVQSDFEQGVITLPLIKAFEKNNDALKAAEAGTLTRDELNTIVSEVDGVAFTKQKANSYLEESLALIETLNVSDTKKDKLIAYSKKAMGK